MEVNTDACDIPTQTVPQTTSRDDLKEGLEKILKEIKTLDNLEDMPAYVVRNFIPGRVHDLEGGLSFGRAVNILNIKDIITSIRSLKDIHVNLTMNDKTIDTMLPEDDTGSFRKDDVTYVYPNCPKGFPVERLARLHLGRDAKTIERYESDLQKQGSWAKMIENGCVDAKHLDILFQKVSRTTHGNAVAFVTRWTEIQTSYHVDTSEEIRDRISIHPLYYGIMMHDLIRMHRPFVRGNGRLARLILCHCMLRGHMLPPAFDVRCTYVAKAIDMSLREKSKLLVPNNRKNPDMAAKVTRDILSFARYLWESSTREMALLSGGSITSVIQREKQNEMDIVGEILFIVRKNGRVLFHDLMRHLERMGIPDGKCNIYVDKEKKGKFAWKGVSQEVRNSIYQLIEERKIDFGYSCTEEYHSYREPTWEAVSDEWIPSSLVISA